MRITGVVVAPFALLWAACPAPPPPELGTDAGVEERPSEGGSVAWAEELPNPYVFPAPDDADGVLDPIGVDFFLQYTVELPEPNTPPAHLVVEICSQRASAAEPSCDIGFDDDAIAGGGGYRWGFDPSQYDSGFNTFEHTLRLTQGAFDIDEQTLRFEVTAP